MTNTLSKPSILHHRLYGVLGLILLVALYLFFGLAGHDPWRGDDARYFGPILSMIEGEGGLFPMIAGEPLTDYPPLYYWAATLFAFICQAFLPLHDGARLASAFFTALTIYFIVRAAQSLYGSNTRAPAALLTLGTLGLVLHVHETQPQTALIAMLALTLAGLARCLHTPLKGAIQAGIGAALAFLAGGIAGLFMALPLFPLTLIACPSCRTPHGSSSLLAGLCIAIALSALWPLALHLTQPEYLALWLRHQWSLMADRTLVTASLSYLPGFLGWFTWPLWPIAVWGLWHHRRHLLTLPWLLPLGAIVVTLTWLVLTRSHAPADALPLIVPLALLAANGSTSLRRGAANAFDWFAVMTFTVFAVFIWTAWSAQALTWPPGLARHMARTMPEFVLPISTPQILSGIFITFAWLLLVWRLPRSPYRGPANWAMGMTMLWCLAVVLLMPWFDYGRSYRAVSHSLAQALASARPNCIATTGLPDSIRSSLHYFSQIHTEPVTNDQTRCNLLLVYDSRDDKIQTPAPDWIPIWTFQRGGNRQRELFRLYQQIDRD